MYAIHACMHAMYVCIACMDGCVHVCMYVCNACMHACMHVTNVCDHTLHVWDGL